MKWNVITRSSSLVCLGIVAFILLFASPSHAQDLDSPKFAAFAGASVVATHAHSLGGMQTGIGYEQSVPNKWIGYGIESGYLGPWSNLKSGSGLISFNYIPSWQLDKKARFVPFASAGYTRLFEIGHALNFGGGLDLRLNNIHAIRFEVRDYYVPQRPEQHNIGFRIGWIAYIWD